LPKIVKIKYLVEYPINIVGKITSEIPHFSLNIKPYDKSISTKTLGDQIQLKTKDLFEKGSLGNYSLTQHYIEDNTLIPLAEGKLSLSSSYKEMNTKRTLAGRKLKVSSSFTELNRVTGLTGGKLK